MSSAFLGSSARKRALLSICFFGLGAAVIAACGSERPGAAGDSADPNYGFNTGPCTPEQEGHSVSCHVETGRVDNLVNCFSGEQVCQNGVWGPCGGPNGTLTTLSMKSIGAGLHILAGSTTASGCATNPCNPYCLGEDTDAGGLTPGGFTSTSIVGTISDPTTFPGGASGPKSIAMEGVNASPPYFWCTPGHPPSDFNDCSYDYCCAHISNATTAYSCVPWVTAGADNAQATDPTNGCTKPAGIVDYQIGLGCTDSTTTHVHVPICNRGGADATSGTLSLKFYPGNPTADGSVGVCTPNHNSNKGCTVNLATRPIAVGKCIDVDVTQANSSSPPSGISCNSVPSGNTTMMVNPGSQASIASVTESGTVATVSTGGTNLGLTANSSYVMITGVGKSPVTVNSVSQTSSTAKVVVSSNPSAAGTDIVAGGQVYVNVVATTYAQKSGTNGASTDATGKVTMTLNTASFPTDLAVGKKVVVSGTTDSNYDGTFAITSIDTVNNRFTYSNPSFPSEGNSGGGTVALDVSGYNGTFTVSSVSTTSPYSISYTTTATGLNSISSLAASTARVPIDAYNGLFKVTGTSSSGSGGSATYSFTYDTGVSGLAAAGAGGFAITGPLPEGDYCNNFSFLPTTSQGGTCSSYGVQPPAPTSSSYTYTATCQPGYLVKWNQFAYSVSPSTGAAGADYDVAFTFTTSGGTSTTVHAKNTTNYPSVCAFSTTASPACTSSPPSDSPCNTPPKAPATAYTCPTNLATLLGSAVSDPSLTVNLSLAAGASTSPTVNSWSITYSCVPNE